MGILLKHDQEARVQEAREDTRRQKQRDKRMTLL